MKLNLTPRQHRVCVLYFGLGRTQPQIARELRVRQATVSLHLAAARAKYPRLTGFTGSVRIRMVGKKILDHIVDPKSVVLCSSR